MQDEGVKLSYPKVFVPPCYLQQPNILSHWRYESRREAQQIYPHLWLGPVGVTRDENFLINNNIRVLISLADMRCKQKGNSKFEYFEFSSGDNLGGDARLVNYFGQINEIIDTAAKNNLTTILFCDSGNDNSATVAAAYVMHHQNCSYVDAIQYVQARRFSISLDDASKHNLVTYQGFLEASAQAVDEPINQGNNNNKRQLEDEDDEGNQMFGGGAGGGEKRRIQD